MIDWYGTKKATPSNGEIEKLMRDLQQAGTSMSQPKAPTLADALGELWKFAAVNADLAETVLGKITGDCATISDAADRGGIPVETAVAAILAEAHRTRVALDAVLERLG